VSKVTGRLFFTSQVRQGCLQESCGGWRSKSARTGLRKSKSGTTVEKIVRYRRFSTFPFVADEFVDRFWIDSTSACTSSLKINGSSLTPLFPQSRLALRFKNRGDVSDLHSISAARVNPGARRAPAVSQITYFLCGQCTWVDEVYYFNFSVPKHPVLRP
jgi:hypothetical protein